MLYLTVLIPFIVNFSPIKNKKIKILLSTILPIYIILFRFGLGTDYFSYQYLYDSFDASRFSNVLNKHANIEFGFRFLFYIFKNLKFSAHYFIATISLISYLLIIKWIDDSELNESIAIMLFNGMFFVVWTLSALRQGLVLSLATYLLFNKKFKTNKIFSLIIITLLATIHLSALIYIPLLLIKDFILSRKQLAYLLLISLTTTLLPLYDFALLFKDVGLISKFYKYINPNFGFWDFSGLIRLAFASFIIYFYDYFKKDKYTQTLAQLSIVGFSLYFILKISENAAGRINIYTFVFSVLIFTSLISYFKKDLIKYGFIFSLSLFSLTYLQKDLLSHQNEVSYTNKTFLYKFRNINTIEVDDYFYYKQRHSFLYYQENTCNSILEELNDLNPTKYPGFMIARARDGSIGIYNDQKRWEIEPFLDKWPDSLVKDYYIIKEDNKLKYFDFNQNEITLSEDEINKLNNELDEIKNQKPIRITVDGNQYKDVLSKYYIQSVDKLSVEKLSYSLPFDYEVLMVKTGYNTSYFKLNDKNEIYPNIIFKNAPKYNINNISIVNTYCKTIYLNSNGDIIWK